MEKHYKYFNRDISWLSFNHRVLLEADDDTLPLYERIKFISIYSSNLEEFYQVRVADLKTIANGGQSDTMTQEEAHSLIREITDAVNVQLEDRVRIYEKKIIPELYRNHIVFYQNRRELCEAHRRYIHKFFMEEVFPYMQPVRIETSMVKVFIRNHRQYMAVRVKDVKTGEFSYFLIKMPYSKVPRFVSLPQIDGYSYIMFLEDVIKDNLKEMFVGYEVDCSYCLKISRDADIVVENVPEDQVVETIKAKVKKRKNGAICRFVYDRNMPQNFLDFLVDAFDINREELVPGDKHLNLEDLSALPNPMPGKFLNPPMQHLQLPDMDDKQYMYKRIVRKDLLLFYPYHSFDFFIHFLYEAVHDVYCRDIMITQYRVAEHSEVINALIAAAQNGKKVTVFVELKARFDEENNLHTAELMRKAGIKIIFSIPGLKVHAKVALVARYDEAGREMKSFAYVSTGNFNEDTAKIYSDVALYTSNKSIVDDMKVLFSVFDRKNQHPQFNSLLITRFNLLSEVKRMIQREIDLVREGRRGRIVLKMNALQDPLMINELYRASEMGVEIDLIVRGICCLIPGEEYSKNIRVTRIVDAYLEHSRIWYFGNGGNAKVYLGSPDWMERNLYRRIEAVAPVLDEKLKAELVRMLEYQLTDNTKACWIDNKLHNIFKCDKGENKVRAQQFVPEIM